MIGSVIHYEYRIWRKFFQNSSQPSLKKLSIDIAMIVKIICKLKLSVMQKTFEEDVLAVLTILWVVLTSNKNSPHIRDKATFIPAMEEDDSLSWMWKKLRKQISVQEELTAHGSRGFDAGGEVSRGSLSCRRYCGVFPRLFLEWIKHRWARGVLRGCYPL